MAFVTSIRKEEESVSAVMRRYPDQAIPLTDLTEIIMRTGNCGFSSQERELIAAFASGTNNCTYCFNTHKATAEAFGVDESLLGSSLKDLEGSPVNAKLKPVLQYVKKLTETPARMVQADVDAIFEAGWDENCFHFTVMICGLFNFYNRLIDGYGVKNTANFRLSRGQALAGHGYSIVTDTLKR
jgi:uncharacterized peroxidase-related enzyme